MAVYSGRYSPYAKPRSGGSAFVEGLTQGISRTLELRRQMVEQKRQEAMMEQAKQEQREFQMFMQQVGAVQRDWQNFAPSVGAELRGTAAARGYPQPVIPDIANLGYQAAQQRGLAQKETTRKAGVEKQRADAATTTAKASMIRANRPPSGGEDKPVFGDKEYDRDWNNMRRIVLTEKEKINVDQFGNILNRDLLNPIEQAEIDSITTDRLNNQWMRQGKTIPERVRGDLLGEFQFIHRKQ